MDSSGIFNNIVQGVAEESARAILAYLGPDQYLFPRLVEYGYWNCIIPLITLDQHNDPQAFHRLLGPAVQRVVTKKHTRLDSCRALLVAKHI